MIKQSIKDKLKLEKTDHHVGMSFVNNCEITFSALLDCYVADCDTSGDPLKNKYLLFRRKPDRWKSVVATEEFIEKELLGNITNFVERHIKI